MDLLQPGLRKSVLRQARSTNTISFKLLDQFQHVLEKTNTFLATLPDIETTAKSTKSTKITDSVAAVFTDFYYHLHMNNDTKLTAVPEISIASLQGYQHRLEELKKTGKKAEFNETLILLMDECCIILALHHLANSILFKTVVAKSHLAYWNNVRFSTWKKLVYGIQTLPQRIYRIVIGGVHNAIRIMEPDPQKLWFSRIFHPFFQSFKGLYASAWRLLNDNFIVKQSRFLVFKVPLKFIDDEIRTKITLLGEELDGQYKVLGVFLNSLPVSEVTLAKILPDAKVRAPRTVIAQLHCIKHYIMQENLPTKTSPPGFIVRYWPLLLLTLGYGPQASFHIWQNRKAIVSWLRRNFVDTFVGFWRNWIVKPVADMLSILRNDETMAIALNESLKSDLDSLERMVMDYLADTNASVSASEVRKAVKQGDLTMVMAQYEDELRTPYKSIIKGLLIRSILIQVQKTKVDGDLAINGIDKLLKLQQLLFGMLLVLPSLFILYQANKALRRDPALSQNMLDRRVDCLKAMNQINRLVNRENSDDKMVSDGKLFVEVVNLNILSQPLVPKSLRSEFLKDLNQLALTCSEDGREKAKSGAVTRIWNMHSPFFRK